MAKNSKTTRSVSSSSSSPDDINDQQNTVTKMVKNTKRSRSVSMNEQEENKPPLVNGGTKRAKSCSSSNQNKEKKPKRVTNKRAQTKTNKKAKIFNKKGKEVEESEYIEDRPLDEEDEEEEEDECLVDGKEVEDKNPLPKKRIIKPPVAKVEKTELKFVGEPVEPQEALRRWPHRYQKKLNEASCSNGSSGSDNSGDRIYATRHYLQAEVDGVIYNIDDDAYVQAEEGKKNYICKIREFFRGDDDELYFTAQWFYRAEDTIIKNCSKLVEAKRVFFSQIRDENPLGCLVKKLNIIRIPHDMDPGMIKIKKLECEFYYDMMYVLPFCSFVSLPSENVESDRENVVPRPVEDMNVSSRDDNVEMTLLDLYAGCGAMSTGLSLGANACGVRLTAKWAVDINESACQSLSHNHPETKVRNERAEDFFRLLKEWERLCVAYSLYESSVDPHPLLKRWTKVDEEEDTVDEAEDDVIVDNVEIFEVEDILDICFGDVNSTKPTGLYFKIRWKNYSKDHDSWEPLDGLSGCPEKLKEFVTRGFKNNILPLPGRVDVICGGPPCQGISGYNRFRNFEKPLEDEKNQQLIVYLDIIQHLKPRYVLMENVVDILKFSMGYLARHAFGSLVHMNYQARLGMMAAGSYGLPQYRMRIFLWAALQHEKLPGYPLPTHHVNVRGLTPKEFEANVVDYEKGTNVQLKRDLKLRDAISDLPQVQNDEERDAMPYVDNPNTTDFQRFIKQRRGVMPGSLPHARVPEQHLLYDHRPLRLNKDDYARVCKIPRRKGANFRDLEGVRVSDNKAELDPTVDRVFLPSKKPLVPDYAIKFKKGTSLRPFGRLWHDEIVSTVMTRAEPHNHTLLHPEQDRVLSVRENARLQGFPDYYRLYGKIKERYIQVGNAVAVPVACALGYSLALTLRGLANGEPVFRLPEDYPFSTAEGSEAEAQP